MQAAALPDVPTDAIHPFASVHSKYRTKLVLSRNLTYISPALAAGHVRVRR